MGTKHSVACRNQVRADPSAERACPDPTTATTATATGPTPLLTGEHGIYLLMGPIEVDTVRPLIEWILYENLQMPIRRPIRSELVLMVCSAQAARPRRGA